MADAAGRLRPYVVWSPTYEVDLGPHVFVTAKYRLAKERLLAEGTLREGDLVDPVAASPEQLALAHDAAYLAKIESGAFSLDELIRLEVPFTPEVREAMTLACGGTLQAARTALDAGVTVHLGGGFHHAFAGHGEGFCLMNDIVVAARGVIGDGLVDRVAVVDLDVHHGNGTAAILADDDAIFTCSMHQENNYPAVKPPSDLDVGLEDRIGDAAYLDRLDETLDAVLETEPELIIYLAGADPFVDDQLGGLSLTLAGLRRRDRAVFEAASASGVPVTAVLAGGYAVRLEDTVAIHVATVEEAFTAR